MNRPPNILWIVTTQWRAQACGYAGDPNACTPHLDALAAQSVNYVQAVTPHPFGPMARAALLTGVASPENGVKEYFDALPAGARTIAHDLGARGYATAFFGKWGVGKRDPRVPLVGEAAARVVIPEDARGGFEFFEGFEGGFLVNDPWLHGTGEGLAEAQCFPGYQSAVLADRWVRWAARRTDARPVFAAVSLEAPHPPYAAPAPGVVARDPGEIGLAANVPRGGLAEQKTRRELAGYYTHIEATDRAIGRLVEGTAKDWVVVFTSVHGDMHGAHGLFRKGWPYEESVRVPLLIRAPGVTARVDESAVSLLDVGELTVASLEGRRAALGGDFALISMPSVVKLPHQCDREWSGWRSRTRKLVLDGRGEPWLFFDLERDPLEMKNLAPDPAREAEMVQLRRQASLQHDLRRVGQPHLREQSPEPGD